jgi:hypothetical protein
VSGNRTPLGGHPLEQPDPAPLRVFALYDADKPCTEHSVAYTGRIPCTGAVRCYICGTEWEPTTGRLLKRAGGGHVCGRHCGPGYHPDGVTVHLIETYERDHKA